MTAAPTSTSGTWIQQAPFYLTAAAAVTTEVSIAASQILMGLAILALAATRQRFRWPSIATPLAVWMGWTLVSLAMSGNLHRGLPQIKKFYVYLMLLLVTNTIRDLPKIRGVVLGWAAAAALSSAWGLEQFVRKYEAARAAHMDFYLAYVGDRITGFMGHWMTFSGQMMLAVLWMLAYLLFGHEARTKKWLVPALLLASAALLAALTRSMWGGAAAGALYLLWCKRRSLIIALPVLAALILLINPVGVRERAISIVRPHGDVDSNEHRSLLRRIGWQMIKAHPLVGLGPEEVGPNLKRFIPADFSGPLPTGYYEHLHNIYFHYAAERGLPALGALLWFFGLALYHFGHALRRAPQNAETLWILHGAIAATIAFMFGGYFEVNWGDSEVLGMFLAIVGCGWVASQYSRESDTASASA